jgi:hypothetical protein
VPTGSHSTGRVGVGMHTPRPKSRNHEISGIPFVKGCGGLAESGRGRFRADLFIWLVRVQLPYVCVPSGDEYVRNPNQQHPGSLASRERPRVL